MKFPDSPEYKITNLQELSLNKKNLSITFKETGRLIKVENKNLYFLNNKDKTLIVYEIDIKKGTCEKSKNNSLLIKNANF